MAGSSDLYLLARELLDACAAAVAAAPAGQISRAYVSPGPPPFDCEMLVVHAGGPAEAETAPLSPPLQPGFRTTQGALHLINLTVTVLRCVPVGDELQPIPASADLETAAQATYADCWAIWNHLRTEHRTGSLFRRSDGEPRELFFSPAVPLGPDGRLAGWQLEIRVQLDGYEA